MIWFNQERDGLTKAYLERFYGPLEPSEEPGFYQSLNKKTDKEAPEA